MKGFDSKFIEEVKNKNDLIDTVAKYVRLEQRGRNFWGCCPFHHEKTPSFCAHSAEQFYHCYGCHKSGDVISFIQEMELLDFFDAVKFLAEKAHIPLPDVSYDSEEIKEAKKRKDRLTALMKDTAMFYVNNLRKPSAFKHVEYLNKRQISSEFITKFGLGASLDFNSLVTYLENKGYTAEEMVASGAVSEKDGRRFDALGGRLIVPIINQFNQVIAFGGRLLEKADFGKYKNTRDTSLFSKSNVLYNINNLKKIKNERGLSDVIIVEGYMDTISLVSGGIENVVASMGTSLTKEQARILKRYTDKVYISYDGDSAGQNATVRGLEILKDEGLEVRVVSLPDGLDPDDVVKKYGVSYYRDLLKNSKPLIDFKLDLVKKSYDLGTVDGRRKYVVKACAVIRESASPVEQEDLLKTVRDLTGFSFDALKRELYATEEEKKEPPKEFSTVSDSVDDKFVTASRFILFSYLFGREYSSEVDISELVFALPIHRLIKSYIIDKTLKGEPLKFTELYEIPLGEQGEFEKELGAIASMETYGSGKFDAEIYFLDCVKTVKRESIDKELDLLKKTFAEEKDNGKRREIAAEMTKLLANKNKLSKKN